MDVETSLPLLLEGETVGTRWRDVPPDVSGEGTLAGPEPVELCLGRVVSESDWEAFCQAMEKLLRRQWEPAAVAVISDNSDDAQQRRIWLEKVVEPASGREMVQAWVVTTVYEDILLSLPAGGTRRCRNGGSRGAEKPVQSDGRRSAPCPACTDDAPRQQLRKRVLPSNQAGRSHVAHPACCGLLVME